MKHSVIIVDDEKWIRELVRLSLDWERFDCEVVGVFRDGQSAIAFAREKKPDLIILDMEMPGASGLDVLDSMITDFPESKIIVLSGYSDFEYVRHALRRGACDYLLKPLDEEQLAGVVKKAIGEIDEREMNLARQRQTKARMVRLETKRLEPEQEGRIHTGDSRIDAVLKQIDSSLHNPPTLEQAADSVGLAPTYFSALFSRIVGSSYVESLRDRRIARSKELLETTWMRVGEIAALVGYPNSNYFAKVFQRNTGLLPSEYRKTRQSKEIP